MKHVGVALVILLLLPSALALPGRLDLRSDRPVDIDGALAAGAPSGGFFLEADRGTGEVVATGVSGTLTLVTREVAVGPNSRQTVGDPVIDTIPLTNATVRVVFQDERAHFRVAARTDGLVEALGPARGTGRFAPLPVPFHYEGCGATGPREWMVPICWPRGWSYLGPIDAPEVPPAFPEVSQATLRAEGPILAMAPFGLLRIEEPGRAPREERLGVVAPGPTGAIPLRIETTRRALLDVTVASLEAPALTTWGLAGPQLDLRLTGSASWTQASGHAVVDGRVERFDDASVVARLEGARLGIEHPLAAGPDRYRGEGEFTALRVDGVVVRPPPDVTAPVGAGVAATLLVLLAFSKTAQMLVAAGIASLYSRLVRDDVLGHEQRRRMMETIRAEPGIHQRELHRRMGGAWGPFAFHLRILERNGHIRLSNGSRYVLLYPAGVEENPAAIPHPLTRGVYERLPEDGTPRRASELQAEMGVSRELLRYHVLTLEAKGLVVRVKLADAKSGIARVVPPAASVAKTPA